MRRMLMEVLDGTPDIDMVGSAPGGRLGVALLSLVKPDVVLLEASTVRADVLATLTAIRMAAPGLPVIMFSPAAGAGAAVALEALNRGADDYVAQPGTHAPGGPIRYLLDEVCPALRRLGAAGGTGADRRIDRMIEGLPVYHVEVPGEASSEAPVGSRRATPPPARS
jgi:two-component system chemotaxis response regulator CheB